MNWDLKLKEVFGDDILSAKETSSDGFILLEVTVKYTDMQKVNELSYKINEWFDNENIDRFDGLEVHSPGINLSYEVNELNNHIGENLLIKLYKTENKVNEYICTLLQFNDADIIIKWNQKGNIRKIKVDKSNILSVEKFIKF
ncbi:ribosome assembly cofactor RimP [Mycoplasma sp. ES3157-GEN-MYC]|uniref:Ribosome assembly cofactor RimP n=1 Tax=Mycoplasma miroungigenitalium TaxID=754515 RepID=A0A6M4J9A1_9MOLU|nr:ribosome assembly cofactor RimP [Mycoplasma miroungigenitalium]MBU4690416.1 ribosome assembly cofactor RimP [Mycoplasma miroungigenitalium]MBU4691683.1 ribosome assembly cofactor RimP [Mycoplasma miroungigenitalium]QJR43510.1 ribosome assembly cofactor RimP [Mycoplasma miroungigenitalium]